MVNFVTDNAEYGNLIVITINGRDSYSTEFPRNNMKVIQLYTRLGVDRIKNCPIEIGN